MSEEEKWKLSFEYAWRYFDFHAKQRMSMFNFFLVFSGFFVTACVQLSAKGEVGTTGEINSTFLKIILGLGIIITIFFIFLDRRNEELVHIAEDLLKKIEKGYLFKGYKFEKDDELKIRERNIIGSMKEDDEKNNKGEFPNVGIFNRIIQEKSKYKTGIWLPRVQGALIVFYLIFIVYLLFLKS